MLLATGLSEGKPFDFLHFGTGFFPGGETFALQAKDKGGGTISNEEWMARLKPLSSAQVEVAQRARFEKGVDPIAKLASEFEDVLEWTRSVQSILIPEGQGVAGEVFVIFKGQEPEPETAREPARAGLNTKSLGELSDAFGATTQAHKAVVFRGISEQGVSHEDGLAWFELLLPGKISESKARAFCKDLAEAINVRVLFNRVQSDANGFVVHGCMDIDPEALDEPQVPAYSRTVEAFEFMSDYGEEFYPKKPKATPKVKKPKP